MRPLLIPTAGLTFTAGLLLTAELLASQPKIPSPRTYDGPVIDVHVHVFPATGNGPAPNAACVGMAADLRYDPAQSWPERLVQLMLEPPCDDPIHGPATDDEVREQTIAALQRNRARGILSGSPQAVREWQERAPGLFIAARALNIAHDTDVTAAQLAAEFRRGDFAVLGEVTNQYDGILADDPAFAAYWETAAELDIPVGIHLGVGPPGAPNGLYPDFRVQSPRRMERVLNRHPRLRVYLMHAGYPFIDDLKAMLYLYPQLYVDTGVLQLALPRAEYYAFLEQLVRSGFEDRIMFGSDQMNWPGLIDEGIRAINSAPFLSLEQKKAILHDNAARFFRLSGDRH